MTEENFEGEVIWFRIKPGFGFIKWEKNGELQKDMFVHYSDINCDGFKLLKPEQKVTFAIGKNHNGDPKAINVTVIK